MSDYAIATEHSGLPLKRDVPLRFSWKTARAGTNTLPKSHLSENFQEGLIPCLRF